MGALQRAQGIQADRDRYLTLGLERNPFPFASISAPEEAASLPPLSDREMESVERFLSAPRPALLWVSGEYGMGKTHILYWLKERISGSGGGLLGAYYIPNPGKSLADLVQQIMQSVGREDLGHKIRQLVIRYFRDDVKGRGISAVLSEIRQGQSILQTPEQSEMVNRLLDEEHAVNDAAWSNLARILFPRWEGVITYAGNVLSRRHVGPSSVCDDLVGFAFEPEGMDAHAWSALLGGKKRPPVTSEDYLRVLLRVLISSGFRRVFLLIDEMEDLLVSGRLTSRQKTDYLASFRLLLDESLAELGVVMAGVPAAWDAFQELYAAMKGRTTVRLELERLDKATAPLLVKRFLRLAKGTQDDSLAPFIADSIARAVRGSEGNRRLFIARCYHAVEYAAEHKKTQITPEDVQASGENLSV